MITPFWKSNNAVFRGILHVTDTIVVSENLFNDGERKYIRSVDIGIYIWIRIIIAK